MPAGPAAHHRPQKNSSSKRDAEHYHGILLELGAPVRRAADAALEFIEVLPELVPLRLDVVQDLV
jgi:hypothetical protein